MSSTTTRQGFVALSMHFEAIIEDNITIHKKHYDKTSISMHHADILPDMTDAILVSQASYTALEAEYGVLCGSI